MSKTIDLGRVVGNSAYEDAVANGYVGTLEQWLASLKGEKGERGEQGIQGIQGERGLQGEQGIQGVAGQDGQNGADGQDGQDGYSPTVSLSKSGKTTTLVIKDKNGTYSSTIVDGNDGQNGQDGRDGTNGTNGQDGADGQDGVSPAVTITSIQGGHRVNITDATHPQGQNFDVMDGQGGGISDAPSDGKVYVRKDEEWAEGVEKSDVISEGQETKNIETNLASTFRWGSVAMQESKGIGSNGAMIDSTSNNVWVITLTAPISVYFDMNDIPLTYYAFSCIKNGVQQPRMRYQATGDHTLPTYDTKIALSAGDTIYLCGARQEVVSLIKLKIWVEYTESWKSLDSSISVDATQITNANLLAGNDMYVEKSANELDVYIKNSEGKFIKYPLLHEAKAYEGETTAPAFYDCWGIREVALCSMEGTMIAEATLFSHSEAELTSKVPAYNDTMYAVGGEMHGYENVKVEDNKRDVLLLIDGVQVAEDAVVNLRASKRVEMVQLTQVYQVGTNSNPFGEVTKRWIFEGGKMTLTASIKFIRELELDHIYIGIMGIYRRWEGDTANSYLTSRAVKNNKPFKIFNIEDGWNDNDIGIRDANCTKIEVWGERNISASVEVQSHSTATNQGMFIATNNSVYNKIYYQVVGSVANTSIDSEYSATIEWSIL